MSGAYANLPYSARPSHIAQGRAVGQVQSQFLHDCPRAAWQGYVGVPSGAFHQFVDAYVEEVLNRGPEHASIARTLRDKGSSGQRKAVRLSASVPGEFDAHCEVVLQASGADIFLNIAPYYITRRNAFRWLMWLGGPFRAIAVEILAFLISAISGRLADAFAKSFSSVPQASPGGETRAAELAAAAAACAREARTRFQREQYRPTYRPDVI